MWFRRRVEHPSQYFIFLELTPFPVVFVFLHRLGLILENGKYLVVTEDGLLAGERYLVDHCEQFDNGLPEGDFFRKKFIQSLLMEIFHASGITLRLPESHLKLRSQTALTAHSTTHWIPVLR